MQSYKDWEKLNENFGFTLGLQTPASLGAIGALGVDIDGNDIQEGKNKKKKMFGDENEPTDDDDDSGDNDSGDELVKPAAPKDKDVDAGDDDSSDSDCGDDADAGDEKKPPFMSKKKSKKSSKKMKKEESEPSKEEDDFWDSLTSQTANVLSSNWDGMPQNEEALIAPTDPNAEMADGEAGPGEVGYAPSGKLGETPTYEEWKKLNFGDE